MGQLGQLAFLPLCMRKGVHWCWPPGRGPRWAFASVCSESGQPGPEAFAKPALPQLAGLTQGLEHMFALICICSLSCIHYLTSLGLGRGSGAKGGSSLFLSPVENCPTR